MANKRYKVKILETVEHTMVLDAPEGDMEYLRHAIVDYLSQDDNKEELYETDCSANSFTWEIIEAH